MREAGPARRRHDGAVTSQARPRLASLSITRPDLAIALTAAGALGFITALAADDGGYFPTAWNTGAVALLWTTALLVLLPTRPRLATLDLVFLGALAGLVAWIGLSIAWSIDQGQSVLELQRAVLYLAAAATLLLVARRRLVGALVGGALTAIVLISGYGLATRLFPERVGAFDSVAGYRLFTPIGYWNGLGLFAAIGVLLALGIAARGASPVARALAAASLPLLACTLYFTFSRGAWLALAAGVIALLAVSPRRLAITVAVVATGLPAVAAVWVASRSFGLTHREALIAQATHDGHRLALLLVPLAGLSALAAVGLGRLEPRLALSRRAGRAVAAVVLGALVCAAIVAVVAKGGPVAIVRDGYDSFASPTPAAAGGADLNQRLFQFSGTGRARLSEVAVDAYRDHPLLGTGAGGYERYFLQHGDGQIVRDAHNLYLETLAELGPLGLLLLLAVLAAPVVAGLRARSVPLVPAALAAYLAFLVHASVNWDWEMTSITVTAILLGAVLLAASRRREEEVPLATGARVAVIVPALAVAGLCIVALVGNRAHAAALDASLAGRWSDAESHARTAVRWQPWSSNARMLLGRAQGGEGRLGEARATLRQAIERDPDDWTLWFELARWSDGAAVTRALNRAAALNPKSVEVAQFREALRSAPAPRAGA